jgi:hypothetical protein
MTVEQLTFGLAATRIGVQRHHIDKLAKRGVIPHTSTGRFRVVRVEDLPAIREACRKAGYLRDSESLAAC